MCLGVFSHGIISPWMNASRHSALSPAKENPLGKGFLELGEKDHLGKAFWSN